MSDELSKLKVIPDIQTLRRSILEDIYADQDQQDNLAKKEVIRQLMGVIIAAKKNGKSYQEIAEVLQKNGLDINENTLRAYYFDLKADYELQAETQALAKKIQESRQQIILKKMASADASTNAEVTRQYFSKRNPRKEETPKNTATYSPAPAPAAPEPGAASPPKAAVEMDVRGGGAPTISYLEAIATDRTPQFELDEDLIIKGETVVYASGKPFEGALSARQIRLLKVSKRLIARNKGAKTSASFVAMKKDL